MDVPQTNVIDYAKQNAHTVNSYGFIRITYLGDIAAMIEKSQNNVG
jgi:hypothetical protein